MKYRVLVTETYEYETERLDVDWAVVTMMLGKHRGVSAEALRRVDYYVYEPESSEAVSSGTAWFLAD